MRNLVIIAIRLIAVWTFAESLALYASSAGSFLSGSEVSAVISGLGFAIGVGIIGPLLLWFSAPFVAALNCSRIEANALHFSISSQELLLIFLVSMGTHFISHALPYLAQVVVLLFSGPAPEGLDTTGKLLYDQGITSNLIGGIVRFGIGLVLIIKAGSFVNVFVSRNRS